MDALAGGRLAQVRQAPARRAGHALPGGAPPPGRHAAALGTQAPSAGAAADVLLNGRLIAHGEIVVVDQDYAVRINQILDVAEGLG